MEGLTEGRIVHYILPQGSSQGEHRPAIVVKVWNKETGLVNLQVFLDGTNDGLGGIHAAGLLWATSIGHSEKHLLNTWHWIEKA